MSTPDQPKGHGRYWEHGKHAGADHTDPDSLSAVLLRRVLMRATSPEGAIEIIGEIAEVIGNVAISPQGRRLARDLTIAIRRFAQAVNGTPAEADDPDLIADVAACLSDPDPDVRTIGSLVARLGAGRVVDIVARCAECDLEPSPEDSET